VAPRIIPPVMVDYIDSARRYKVTIHAPLPPLSSRNC
jgi:hypothetical protein